MLSDSPMLWISTFQLFLTLFNYHTHYLILSSGHRKEGSVL